jgi:hypothetical protein
VSEPRKTDYFGTYLKEVRGVTALEQVLNLLRSGPQTVGQLATTLPVSPEEVASAIANARKLGYVRLEKSGHDTTVTLLSPPIA